MLYAGLDLSRQRLDVHILDEDGQTVDVTAVRPDGDALRTLVSHVQRPGQEVTAAIESMTGARFVHDQLELAGWDVAIGDAAKVKPGFRSSRSREYLWACSRPGRAPAGGDGDASQAVWAAGVGARPRMRGGSGSDSALSRAA